MTELNLETLRAQIDDLDTQIADLFKKRMEIALEVAKYKKENDLPVLNSQREKEILCKVSEQIGEPLDEYGRILFNTLFDLSKTYQQDYLSDDSNK